MPPLPPAASTGTQPGGERGRGALAQVRFGHVWVDALTFAEALAEIAALVESGVGGCVFTPNVDHVVTAEDDSLFRAAYAEADLVLADGKPLIWCSRLIGSPLPEKISGSDLVEPLLELAGQRRWRVYLLGGAPGVVESVSARLVGEMGVCVAGIESPTVRADAAPGDDDEVVARLRAARPDLVLVALGSPKGERFIHRVLPRIRPAVAISVGAALDFLVGRIRRAPRWMSRAGLEWLFRLSLEPRRLAHRYLVRDPRFLTVLSRTLATPRSQRVRSWTRALPRGG